MAISLNIDKSFSILNLCRKRKLPEYICYRHPKKNVYHLLNKEGQLTGRMVAMPEYIPDSETFYPNMSGYYSLYVKRIFIEPEFRNKKACTALLNIAARDSYKRSCDGKVHLIAKDLEYKGNHPQKLYRKFGFDSQHKTHIDYIDESIQNNTPLPKLVKWETPMFLPLKKK